MSFYDFMAHKAPTQKIIDAHSKDFNYNTAKDYLKKCGGVKAYIRSLGGVFTKYVDFNGKITTQEQLTEIGDYVTGLYDIWGVDYSNGCDYEFSENRYKAKCGCVGAFYPAHDPKARFGVNYSVFGFANGDWLPTIEEQLEKGYAVVNCAQGVVQILKKCGLVPKSFPDPAYKPQYYLDHGYGYKLIKNMKDLRVGDVLALAHGSIPNRSSITRLGNWESWLFHTTIVAEKTDKYIITYDTGHAYTYYGEVRNKRNLNQSPYEWCDDWIGIRLDVTANLTKDGQWEEINGKWQYIKGGKPVKGWNFLSWSKGENWFYFDSNGYMLTGFHDLKWSGGTNRFYFESTGAMVTGWKKISNKWYYFEASGAMATGLRQLKYKDKWDYYLFDKDGVMQTGKKKVKVKFGTNGMTGGHL